MNENKKRINSFLHFLRDIVRDNPNFKLTKNNIYDWITKLDVSPEEYDEDLVKYGWFDEWKNMFPEQNNTGNYPHTFFSYFKNNEIAFINVDNPIKMFIPIDIKHIKESFEKIITFLNDKNITYQTKISREIRIDDIVIRVTSEKDARTIIDFINNDEYIKEGLLKPSPFCFNYNGIALTLDGNNSYHKVVGELIYDYIIEKNEKKDLETIGYVDFSNYVEKLYTNKYENFSEFSKNILPDYETKFSPEGILLIDKQINKFIISSSKEDFNDEKFFQLFNDFNDSKKNKEEKEDFCVLRLLNNIINIHGNKYGLEDTLNGLKLYKQSENLFYITDNGMLRTQLESNDFLNKLNHFLNKYNTTIDELFVLLPKNNVKKIKFEPKNDEQINKIKNNLGKKLVNIIDDLSAIEIENIKNVANTERYNNTQLIQNALVTSIKKLKFFLITLEPKTITRKKNLRQRCINIRPDLLNIIYNSDIKLDDYLSSSIQDSILLKESVLDNAIYTTYKKYQDYYENGNIEYDGMSFVKYALDLLLTENNYNGFTALENVRSNLTLIENNDLIKIISKKTNKPNIKTILHSDVKRIDLLEEYIVIVINDFEKKINSITL